MKQWLILFTCLVFVSASVLSSGFIRGGIDLASFASLFLIVLVMKEKSAHQ